MAETVLDRMTRSKLCLLVESQGQLALASDRPGLMPLRDAVFDHPQLVDGADVAVPAAGLAVAYLLIHGKAGRVFAPVMTQEARRALEDEGIEHHAGKLVKKLQDERGGSGGAAEHEVLDERARQAVTPLAFVEDLRRSG
jgi:hypothetical protein